MENGDSLYARIAELEKENEKLKEKNGELEDLVHNLGGRKCEICGKGNGELGLTALEMDYDDTTGFNCCQGQECLRQFWKGCDEDTDDEDEEEEEEVLENLTCAQLKQRLRAINKPVGGRKAELIQRIREHERLTAALFEED